MSAALLVPSHPGPLGALDDDSLWALATRLGALGMHVDRRFVATLPELDRRKLWCKGRRSYASLEEFAGRKGRVRAETVREILAVARALQPYPGIWALIESGIEGWSKARVVLPYLDRAPEAWWVATLRKLPKRALEDLVRGWREAAAQMSAAPGPGGVPASRETRTTAAAKVAHPVQSPEPPALPGEDRGSPAGLSIRSPGHPPGATQGVAIVVAPEVAARLEAYRAKLAIARGLDVGLDEALGTLLEEGEAGAPGPAPHVQVIVKIAETGEFLARTPEGWVSRDPASDPVVLGEPQASYEYGALRSGAIEAAHLARGQEPPPRVTRFVRLRAGGYCEAGRCRRVGRHLHHRNRRSGVEHHPDGLALLCVEHHQMCHAGAVANEWDAPGRWRGVGPGERAEEAACPAARPQLRAARGRAAAVAAACDRLAQEVRARARRVG